MTERQAGTLYIVGTPIGNLSDLSPRAAEVLGSVDAVICEDTRRTGRLLAHIGSSARGSSARGSSGRAAGAGSQRASLLVANEHTEVPRIDEIIERLERGERMALVTDAGMPTISDPGRHVVAAVVERGLAIEVVPGPTAVSAALALSGLPVDRFVFEGFLPRKGRERTERLADIGRETRAIVLYEAPHRLRKTLTDLAATCGAERQVAVAREMTKLYEEVVRTTLAGAATHFDENEPRGEFVIVLAGVATERAVPSDDELIVSLRRSIDTGLSKRDAVTEVVRETGEPKRRVYELSNGI